MEDQKNILHGPPCVKPPNISLGQQFLDSLRANSDPVFLIDLHSGRQVTRKEILEKSIKLANVLKARGVKIGDRISVASKNRAEWIIVACATLYIGAIFNPLNPIYSEREFRHLLGISTPKIIFVTRDTEKLISKILPSLSWTMEIIEIDDEPHCTNVPTLREVLERNINSTDPKYVATDIGDSSKHPAVIFSSSGTTGLPKGVALSHRNLLALLSFVTSKHYIDIRENDNISLFLPFYHGYAFSLIAMAIITNAKITMMHTFDQNMLLDSIERYKVTHLTLVPPILVLLAQHPKLDKYDLSSVREIVCGAAPIPKDLLKTIHKRLKCQYIRNGYGMTELTVLNNLSGRVYSEDGNVGPLLPHILGKVIDQVTQKPLGPGEVGELCFKGERVMLGYYNNAQATAETIDKDGWLHSGDLGYYDKSGTFFITGRVKELIKYKGYQIAPSEIETLILTYPGVIDAAVVGKPDAYNGEVPVAFVVKAPGSSVTDKDIIQFVKENLSAQKWLRGGVRFVSAIPKNPTGKILRKELQEVISKL